MDEKRQARQRYGDSESDELALFADLAARLGHREYFTLLAERLMEAAGAFGALVVEAGEGLCKVRAFLNGEAAVPSDSLPPEGLWDALLHAVHPVSYSDVRAVFPGDPWLARHDSAVAAGIAIPCGDDAAAGFLALFWLEPDADTSTALRLLPSAAALAGATFGWEDLHRANYRLFREAEIKQKELAFIHTLTEALRTRASLEELCGSVARLVPLAWRHSDAARARIVLDDLIFESRPFQDTPSRLASEIFANGTSRGTVEVFYVESWWPEGDSPFEAEEQYLLDSIARTLGEAIERREGEVKLREESISLARERNRLETILRGIGEGVVVTDSENRILLMNGAAQTLLGTADSEPLGVDFLSLLTDDAFLDVWRVTAAQNRNFSKQELKISEPRARSLWVTRSSIPGLSEGRAGYVTVLHDVTKEREIDQMKTDFVSAVSHELRTPLTSIKGFAVTLRGKPDIEPELRTRFLNIIAEEADRLGTLVEELLILARIESGRMVMGQEPVDMGALIHSVFEAFQPEADKRSISLEKAVPVELGKPLGDREKIRIIVANLVENAVKFTPPGGTVRVKATQDGNELILAVSDTGIGIPKADQQRIFERFYRVHRPGHTEPGTGLGLFIVREMVLLHGGHIEVSSAANEGSVFTVYLPLGQRRGAGDGRGESV